VTSCPNAIWSRQRFGISVAHCTIGIWSCDRGSDEEPGVRPVIGNRMSHNKQRLHKVGYFGERCSLAGLRHLTSRRSSWGPVCCWPLLFLRHRDPRFEEPRSARWTRCGECDRTSCLMHQRMKMTTKKASALSRFRNQLQHAPRRRQPLHPLPGRKLE
jgi:hypothetical protein